MKRIATLATFALVLASTAAQAQLETPEYDYKKISISPSMESSLDKCKEAVKTDWAACPTIEKYQLSHINKAAVAHFLGEIHGLTPERMDAEAANEMLYGSFDGQLNVMFHVMAEDGIDLKSDIAGLEKVRDALAAYVSGSERGGAEIFGDSDAYWAPSVNARAVVLINRSKKTVTIVLHGDTDG